jgi:hypothetical protein
MSSAALASIAVEGGDLSLGEGLLAIIRPALDLIEPGGVMAVLSSSPQVKDDLATWCRVERHDYLGCEEISEGKFHHFIRRGSLSIPRGERETAVNLPLREGMLKAADVLSTIPMPERADPSTGFAPRGARAEPGGPSYPYTLTERNRVAPPEVAELYDQAVGAQWDAARDIAWDKIKPLSAPLETALGQMMTFLAENELSALYVPAKFIPQIHPAYAEVAMFLATQLADEARHIDVFLKRARVKGGLGISSATTSRSLLSLLALTDFTEAAFLLSVLGEGTFLDLLKFIEKHAPDEPTFDLVRRARADETRHVHFGLAHVRHALSHDASLYSRLETAVRRRAATLHNVAGVPAAIQDALTILAARGNDPASVRRGHESFRELLHTMHENRVKRLERAGFTGEQARMLSDLHTPNFM